MQRIEHPRLSIIVPTFREAANLEILVNRISEALVPAGISGEIIIVDDNSQDGTEEICTRLGASHPLRLVVRTRERGLSSAVVEGMRQAVGDILLVMDADLSHPPERIPALVAELTDPEVDMVIGSRYADGGETAEDWGLVRWLNSQAATLLARPLTSAKDPMAGFFALRREAFEAAEPDLDPIGYKIGLELIVKCGFTNIREVPIHFSNRCHGESKLSLREQLNYVRHLHRLYVHRYSGLTRLAKFVLVGLSGLVVDMLAFTMLLLTLNVGSARAAAIWLAMTWNFFLNRHVTFTDARQTSLGRQYLGFCAGCLLGAVVNWSLTMVLCATMPFFANYKILAAFAGAVSGTAFNFVICHHFVFPRRELDPGTATLPLHPVSGEPTEQKRAA